MVEPWLTLETVEVVICRRDGKSDVYINKRFYPADQRNFKVGSKGLVQNCRGDTKSRPDNRPILLLNHLEIVEE